MNWTTIHYREFYDLPRIFITSFQGKKYLFDCPFDDEIDDYPDSYRVYELADVSDEEIKGSWEWLTARTSAQIGEIPVARIEFDPTKRERINTAALEELLAQRDPATSRVA